MNSKMYDSDYFLRGRQTGKSLYADYRWLPNLTIPMVQSIVNYCGIKKSDHILDFGCARGYVVRAFHELGYDAWGYDISEWAINNADESVKHRLSCELPTLNFEWVIAKDVLEHIEQAAGVVSNLMLIAKTGVFVVVPLSLFDGMPYIVADYEKDVTHIHRLCLSSWAKMMMRPGWSVTGAYRINGVKDNYSEWEIGNGFLTARRI